MSIVRICNINKEDIRLDKFLSKSFSNYSRNFFQELINSSNVLVNNKIVNRPGYQIKEYDLIEINFPEISKFVTDSDLGIKILLQHQDFLIIYKPANLISHNSINSKKDITLVDWLLHNNICLPETGTQEQPILVHRLDKNTTGLLIIPKNQDTYSYFINLFKNRLVKKTYLALVMGKFPESGLIEFPISRHPHLPFKMTHEIPSGRDAKTYYKLIKYLQDLDISLVEFKPITGRTHQIRVHAAAIGNSILGDIIYGTSSGLISRHALHAYQLEFWYKDQYFSVWNSLPEDINRIIVEEK